MLHECQVWIDKSVQRVLFWHHEAQRVMPNCDPRDRFVYPYLTRMMDSFSCGALFSYYLPKKKCYNRGVRHFELKSFDVIVTCALSDEIM